LCPYLSTNNIQETSEMTLMGMNTPHTLKETIKKFKKYEPPV
jgi:phage-related holin